MMRLAGIIILLPLPVWAVTLDLPANASLTHEDQSATEIYDMPVGAWTPEGLPVVTAQGVFVQQAWRIEATGLTTQQLTQPLQDQLTEAGFEVLFTCTDDACGGFDFRFATRVIPAPDMQVNFGDYRYVAAQRDSDTGSELISVLASKTTSAGYIQITRLGGGDNPLADTDAAPLRAAGPILTGDLAQELEHYGRYILNDLTFETGSAQLGDATFASLQSLADYLIANPSRTVALVGHTDSVGSLDGNIALSKRRAGSVLERLVSTFGIPRRQVEAEGMGYLSPVASNLTEEGRTANRRVEVIITSTE